MNIIGADFSRWQGVVPFGACADAGIEYAWIKCGHGTGVDPKFTDNWRASAGAFKRGRGAYHWLTEGDPAVQAEASIHRLEATGDIGELLLFVDNEEPSVPFRGEALALHVLRALRRIREILGEAGHYSGAWYLDAFIGERVSGELIAELASFPYWHAEYPRLVIANRRACGLSPPTIPAPTMPRIFRGRRLVVDVHQFDGDGGCVLPNGADADFNASTEEGLYRCRRADRPTPVPDTEPSTPPAIRRSSQRISAVNAPIIEGGAVIDADDGTRPIGRAGEGEKEYVP